MFLALRCTIAGVASRRTAFDRCDTCHLAQVHTVRAVELSVRAAIASMPNRVEFDAGVLARVAEVEDAAEKRAQGLLRN